MKTLLSICLASLLLLSINACKSSKDSAENGETAKVEQAKPGKGKVYREEGGIKEKTQDAANEGVTEEHMKPQDEAPTYRLIISFISWGEGVDPEARNIMNTCMAEMNENTEKEVNFVSMPWGREGEVDFCFMLNELDEEEQENFIKSMKNAFEGRELIQIYENSPALHKR